MMSAWVPTTRRDRTPGRRRLGASALALAAALSITDAPAECTFDKMLRVVVREVTPGVDRGSFAGRPKTLYRVGTRYARTEEALDEEHGLHALIIVNEPDSWLIDLTKKNGRHVIDHGAPFHFHAPIVWTEGMPESLRGLEFGCEVAFMQAHSPAPETREVEAEKVLTYEMVAGMYRVALFVGRKDKKPRAVVVSQDQEVVYGLRYESWEAGLTPDLKLFRPPEGITLEEAP